MMQRARRPLGRVRRGTLLARVEALTDHVTLIDQKDHTRALRELSRWAMSDPEAFALSFEAWGRATPNLDGSATTPNPAFVCVSTVDLIARFDARIQCAPNGRALLKTLAFAPRDGHAL
jgi:hypothetical protein